MKIYILADMEGISGIRKPEQVQTQGGGAEYEDGRRLMTADINAAVEGCFAGGATQVLVADTHGGGGGQVRMEDLDERVSLERPSGRRMMPSLDESFAGVILLGHHAMAGTIGGFLDHTMSSTAWFEYRINGQAVGEIAIEAAWAAHCGVPVIMVHGDEATAREAAATLGQVECAVVKKGLTRNTACCLPLKQAHAIVRETAARAVAGAKAGRFKPFTPSLPATIELTYCRSDMCEAFSLRPGDERVDARTIRRVIDKLEDVRMI